MARTKMTEEQKKEAEARKSSPEGIQETLLKLKQQEADLLVRLAVQRYPNLKDAIATLGTFVNEVIKTDNALSAGADTNLANQSARIEKMIAHYETKIAELRKEKDNANPEAIVNSLKAARQKNLVNLKKALNASESALAGAGLTVSQVLPTIIPLQDDLDATEIPADTVVSE